MKKVILIFSLLTLSLQVFANEPVKELVGKWMYMQEGTLQNGVEKLVAYERSGTCSGDFISFDSNGDFTEFAYFSKEQNNCVEFTNEGSFKINGDQLITSFNGGNDKTYTILELTNSMLKVSYEYSVGEKTFTDIYVFRKL